VGQLGFTSTASTQVLTAFLVMWLQLVPEAHAQSAHTLRFQQPAEKAAHCFARNAEDYSSALMTEVRPRGDGAAMEVQVKVKNGFPYADLQLQPAAHGSTGKLSLNIVSTGKRKDLLHFLTKGC
jgi:hypothetical protein